MGELVNGRWLRTGIDTVLADGELRRPPSVFRNWVTADGTPPEGARGFKAEKDRYHLYVSLACPWAHRTLIMRNLKGLRGIVSLSVAHWHMGDEGWAFTPGPEVIPDPVANVSTLHGLYTLSDPHCTSRVTVPVLFDKAEKTIVSNESADIIRMFNSAFDHLGARAGDYYPDERRVDIDTINARIYAKLNNGVYMAGFADNQRAYNNAVAGVFETLDWLEERVKGQPYLVGDTLTEADIRLFTTLVRFDVAYNGHFKCNLRALTDYPSLWNYTRRLYQHPDIKSTVNFAHIKNHYYGSHPWLNPSGIVPIGPIIDFESARGRDTHA